MGSFNPLENPQGTPTPIAKTLGELYDTVKSGLTQEQQSELQKRAMEKFGGMNGVVAKMKEGISVKTRTELSELLHGMPGKDAILAKIDPLIPTSQDQIRSIADKAGTTDFPVGNLRATADAVADIQSTLKTEGVARASEAAAAVGAIAGAQSVGEVTNGVKAITQVLKETSELISGALKSLYDGFVSLLKNSGFYDFFKAIGGLFGWSSGEGGESGKADAAKPPAQAEGAPARETSELYRSQLRAAGWRHMLKLNTPYAIPIDATKKAEFDRAFDEYIHTVGVQDKDAFFKKLQVDIQGDLSLAKIFSVMKIGAHETPGKEVQALAKFKERLKESGVIRKSLDINKEKLQEDIIKRMEAYGWVNESNRKEKLEKLKKKFEDPKYTQLLQDLDKVIDQTEEVSVGEFALQTLLRTPGIMWDLMGDIIPWSALTVKSIDGLFYFGLRAYTALTTQGFDDALSILSGVSVSELSQETGDKRLLAITILYQQGHLAAALAGMTAKALSAMALMPLYWTQGTGIASVKTQIHQLFGQYDKMAGEISKLTKDTLVPGEYDKLDAFSKELRTHMLEAEAKLHIVDIYKKNPNISQKAIAGELMNRMRHTAANAQIADEVVKSKLNLDVASEKPIQYADFQRIFGKSTGDQSFSAFTTQLRGGFVVEQKEHARILMDKNMTGLNGVLLDAVTDGKGNQWFSRLKSYMKGDVSSIIENLNRGQIIENLNGPEDEQRLKNIKNVLKEVPPGLEKLFGSLSLILTVGLTYQADEGKKLETFMQGLMAMHPFGACYVLFTEGTKMKHHILTNPQYLMSLGIAGIFAGAEAVKFISNVRSVGAGTAFLRSVISPYRVVGSYARGVVNVHRVMTNTGGFKIAGEHLAQVLRGTPKSLRGGGRAAAVVLGLLGIVAIPSIAIAFYDREKMKAHLEKLQKDSYISKDGTVDWDKMVQSGRKWTQEEMEKNAQLAATMYLGDVVANVTTKEKKVDILIHPPKDPSKSILPYGIVDTSEMDHIRGVYAKFGYTVQFTYNTDADKYIEDQRKKLLAEGYTLAQIDELSQKIGYSKLA